MGRAVYEAWLRELRPLALEHHAPQHPRVGSRMIVRACRQVVGKPLHRREIAGVKRDQRGRHDDGIAIGEAERRFCRRDRGRQIVLIDVRLRQRDGLQRGHALITAGQVGADAGCQSLACGVEETEVRIDVGLPQRCQRCAARRLAGRCDVAVRLSCGVDLALRQRGHGERDVGGFAGRIRRDHPRGCLSRRFPVTEVHGVPGQLHSITRIVRQDPQDLSDLLDRRREVELPERRGGVAVARADVCGKPIDQPGESLQCRPAALPADRRVAGLRAEAFPLRHRALERLRLRPVRLGRVGPTDRELHDREAR